MTASNRDTLPSARMVVERATPEDFGGQIGRSMQGLADAGMNLAMRLKANDEKIKGFDYERQFLQLQEQDNLEYEQRMRGLQGSADGHWTSSRDATNKRFSDWLQTLPEKERAEYAAKAQSFQNRRTGQAFRDQYNQQDANTRLVLTEEQRKAGVAVAQQPASYEQFIKDQEALIDKSTLTPLEKDARKQELRNSLAYTAAQAEAQQNPAGVVAANVGGGFRETLRRRESGGNDNAAASTSSALGRYQFLRDTWNRFAAAAGVPAINPAEAGGPNDPRRNADWQEKVLDQYIASSTAALKAQNLPVTDANLYMLHFMGQGGGAQFLQAMAKDGGAIAATLFPEAAAANRSIFFAKNEPRTLSEVYANLTRNFNGAGVTAGVRTAAQQNLNAQQTAAVTEAATMTLLRQQQTMDAVSQAQAAAARNSVYMQIKEGPNPEVAYQEARRAGVLTELSDIQRAEGLLRDRRGAVEELNTGIGLVSGGRGAANQYDPAHRKGIGAVYDNMVSQGVAPGEAAATLFDRTGIMPQKFATAMRGALISEDPQKMLGALTASSNMLRQNPNAMAGVEGGSDLEKAAQRFDFLTQDFGLSGEQAVQKMMQEARDPSRLDPIKSEQLQQFRKNYLTQEKIESRLTGNWTGVIGGTMPKGQQATAIGSIYSEFAREGFEVHRDPNMALKYADEKMKQQFDTQNGVITRYAPSKAGLPALPGIGHKWVNEQAAQIVQQQLGIVVGADQVVLMPVERDGVSTSKVFRNRQGMEVTRADSGNPQQRTAFRSVPYQIVVIPKDEKQQLTIIDGAFFPDVDKYVDDKNKANAELAAKGATTYVDQFGIEATVPMYMADKLLTPEQEQRRKQAEANKRLLEGNAEMRNVRSAIEQQRGMIRAENEARAKAQERITR